MPGWRTSRHKRHVVKHIIAPFGRPIEDRPPVPTLEERIAAVVEKRTAKLERRAARDGAEQEKPPQEPAVAARKKGGRRTGPAAPKPAAETSASDVD